MEEEISTDRKADRTPNLCQTLSAQLLKIRFSDGFALHSSKSICYQPQWRNTIFETVKDKNWFARFEAFTAVTMKNAVFWDVAPCRSCVNRRFGGTYRLHLHGTTSSQRHIPEDAILQQLFRDFDVTYVHCYVYWRMRSEFRSKVWTKYGPRSSMFSIKPRDALMTTSISTIEESMEYMSVKQSNFTSREMK
jgi:hypothetical protein